MAVALGVAMATAMPIEMSINRTDLDVSLLKLESFLVVLTDLDR